jgi:hypothetical protein
VDRKKRKGYQELNPHSPYIIAVENWDYKPEIEYAFSHLLRSLGINFALLPAHEIAESAWLYYGRNKPRFPASFYIPESEFFDLYFQKKLPSKEWLLSVDRSMQDVRASNVLEADIVAATFFVTSGYEETIIPDRDHAGRFPANRSLRWPGLIKRPLVDEWAQSMSKSFKFESHRINSRFAIALSHDIDSLNKGTLEALYDRLIRHPDRHTLSAIWRIITEHLRRGDLYDNLHDLVKNEKARDVRSTFYMLKKTGYSEDANYEWNEPSVLNWMRDIVAEKWEIGLHGSFFSLTDKAFLVQEKRELEQVLGHSVRGGRQHFLRFTIPDSWTTQSDAGFFYDTTLGYADAIGFRNGLARPFQPFDVQTRKRLTIWEMPLVIMDATLKQYLGLSAEKAYSQSTEILQSVRQVNGMVAVLWHNTYFTSYKYPGYAQVYWQIIDWCKKNGGTCGPAGELLDHYLARESK